jgi:phosphatidylglycerophosphate synthase
VGALLFAAHSIIDGCDGELARLKFQESRWGGVLDFWVDNIVHLAIFTCMAVGWAEAESSAWPLVLGIAAILGAGGSAGFVYWRTMRGKSGEGPLFAGVSTAGISTGRREALARFLDGAGGRDFVYLVLALAMFGKSSWFMVLAGVGSPIYLLLLLVLALREGAASAAAPPVKGTVAPPAALET